MDESKQILTQQEIAEMLGQKDIQQMILLKGFHNQLAAKDAEIKKLQEALQEIK